MCCAEVIVSATKGLYFLGFRFDTGSIGEAVCGIVAEARGAGLDFVVHTPPIGFIKSEHEIGGCVEFVVENQAPLIFIAGGMPQQEIPASRIADHPEARGGSGYA